MKPVLNCLTLMILIKLRIVKHYLLHIFRFLSDLYVIDTNGRLEVQCNGKGVLFVEAETDSTVQDIGLLTQSLDLSQLVPTLDYSGDISSFPLLLFQVSLTLLYTENALLNVETYKYKWPLLRCYKSSSPLKRTLKTVFLSEVLDTA